MAVAEIVQWLQVLVKMWSSGKFEIESKSDIISRMCLPFMASAMKEDDEERKALDLLESVRKLNARKK